ncbi:MAG: AAA family ATPase [Sandaracinaceae bacterium]|nr:AAA family ATPase [Sandaracinaceae bacterium]
MTTTLTLRLDAYSKDAQKLISAAQSLADERHHVEVEPLHLFFRLVEKDEGVVAALSRVGVAASDVLLETEAQLRKLLTLTDAVAYLSPRMLDLLTRAEGEAARAGGVPVGTAQLFLSCAQETSGPVSMVLKAVGLSAPVLRASLSGAMPNASAPRSTATNVSANAPADGWKTATAAVASPSKAIAGRPATSGNPLTQFGRDLTGLAAAGKFDPMVGRDAELRRIMQVLARRRDNNPMLVGEPGIGKTTIVQGLAMRIAHGDVPAMLRGKRIVSLDMGALTAGAKLRGELEERMRLVLDAVRDSGGDVILFLPDLAAMFGERAPIGGGDLLLNALSRGEIRVIALATPSDVRKTVSADTGLSRHFVPITIDPPTPDEAIAMLRGICGHFEIAHGVRISDRALVAAVQLVRRYVPSGTLPRSAVDLIDEAAARVRVEMESVPSELDALMRRLESVDVQTKALADDPDRKSKEMSAKLEKEATELKPRIETLRGNWQTQLKNVAESRRIKEEIVAARREEDQARAKEDTTRANDLRAGTIASLEKQLAEVESELSKNASTMVRDTVSDEDVARVINTWTGVPVAKMLEGEADKLLKMEDRLVARVIGQSDAVQAVSKAVRRGRAGLRDPKRPIGSFFFLGPTGVGKTELAKAVAEFLFDDEAALTRLDMSEFMEKHTVARLIGSPPGYVDSEEGGFLTEAVRRKPYSVVLFDELEKGHPDVFNILLQVLDDGRLSDSRGRMAHFADTVIIMTSNVGSSAILDHQGDAQSLRDKTMAELRKVFRPEFLNRIDDIVIFNRLTKENLRGIADIQLKGLSRLLVERGLTLDITDAACDKLTDLGYEPAFGARPLKRVILKNLQDPLAEEVLRGGYAPGDTIRVDLKDDAFTFVKSTG